MHRPNYKLSQVEPWEKELVSMPAPRMEWVSVAVIAGSVVTLCSVLIWGML